MGEVFLSLNNEFPYMKIVDINPLVIPVLLKGTGDLVESYAKFYLIVIDQPLAYFNIYTKMTPPGTRVLFSLDQKEWFEKLYKRGDPYIVDASGSYAYIEIYVKVQFPDIVEYFELGTYKTKIVLLSA